MPYLLLSQLADARQEAQCAIMKLKVVETELSAARQQANQQAKDMLQMSGVCVVRELLMVFLLLEL